MMYDQGITLDKTDLAILSALQSDGRLTTVELARRINLSPTPTAARVRALTDAGVITGYHARLDPAALDRALLVFVQVTLHNTDQATLAAFNEEMRRMPDILECHMVGGGFDYFLKVRFANMDDYRKFLGTVISAMPSVAGTHSYFVMQQVKDQGPLPLPSALTITP